MGMKYIKIATCERCGVEEKQGSSMRDCAFPNGWMVYDQKLLCPNCLRKRKTLLDSFYTETEAENDNADKSSLDNEEAIQEHRIIHIPADDFCIDVLNHRFRPNAPGFDDLLKFCTTATCYGYTNQTEEEKLKRLNHYCIHEQKQCQELSTRYCSDTVEYCIYQTRLATYQEIVDKIKSMMGQTIKRVKE